jgi:puromycin-sensitive aminopeptidase
MTGRFGHAGKPIGQMMASWTEQMGYPVLTIKGVEMGAGSVTLTVEQTWFLMDGTLVRTGVKVIGLA